ncbi:cyclin-like protein [Schizophyllum amplum]|uniref:Cyclin-like protein n=1 Tax=Schizophyllum amplum TaxID=97359 RepID=A0A550CLU0_9AGAR|nr:cyclin-like protein [Auriculariopsis ampla]
MKDITATASNRHARNAQIYTRKRPSPHGVHKSTKTPVLYPNNAYHTRKSPRSLKRQRETQREAHLAALRREGIFIEDEYREEIRQYMHYMERYTGCSAQSMDQQPEIRWHMRPCLVDFLVEVHFTFRLRPETLYLTLNIVDRYVSRRIVYIKHYQLVGCAALWIAAKFEDAKERVPTVQDLVQVCREAYDESHFIQMEGHVLSTIDWTLGHPTAEAWLRVMCCDPYPEDSRVQHIARFLMEITLFYREFVPYAPSTIALAALTLARYICDKRSHLWETTWDETPECMEVVEFLDIRLAKHVNDLSETVVKKYSYAFYSKAATHVVQWYLQGGRYRRPLATLPTSPVTPLRSPVSCSGTPMSVATSVSDDDMPMTPVTPAAPANDLFGYNSDDKENVPSTFEPVLTGKHRMEQPAEQYLPHDFVSFGRTVLHNMNIGSPNAMVS